MTNYTAITTPTNKQANKKINRCNKGTNYHQKHNYSSASYTHIHTHTYAHTPCNQILKHTHACTHTRARTLTHTDVHTFSDTQNLLWAQAHTHTNSRLSMHSFIRRSALLASHLCVTSMLQLFRTAEDRNPENY